MFNFVAVTMRAHNFLLISFSQGEGSEKTSCDKPGTSVPYVGLSASGSVKNILLSKEGTASRTDWLCLKAYETDKFETDIFKRFKNYVG